MLMSGVPEDAGETDDIATIPQIPSRHCVSQPMEPGTWQPEPSKKTVIATKSVTLLPSPPVSCREHFQNFVPHPRYYGAEPAEIADEAQRTDTHGEALPPPAWSTPVSLDDMRDARARVAPAHARRGGADTAQPLRLVASARGRGGHRPGRPVGQRRPHLARASVPVRAPDAQAARPARLRAHRASLRVPAVHGRRLDRAGRARRDQDDVLELHPAPRVRPPRGAADAPRPGGRRDRQGPQRRGAGRGGAHGAVRRDAARRPSRTCARPPTSCAASWPATP